MMQARAVAKHAGQLWSNVAVSTRDPICNICSICLDRLCTDALALATSRHDVGLLNYVVCDHWLCDSAEN